MRVARECRRLAVVHTGNLAESPLRKLQPRDTHKGFDGLKVVGSSQTITVCLVFSILEFLTIEMSSDSKPDIFTYADFDLQALCHKASTLRQGVSCVCRPDQRPCSGSFNWAIFISFEDGIRWVFRSPHPRPFISIEIGMKLLASEATTLRYLRAHSDVPVPEVYNY